MLHLGPGSGAGPAEGSPEPDEDADDEPRVPGMQKTTPDEAAALEKAAVAKRARADDPDSSGIDEERLRELKEKARAGIEARLVARRKQRRLLRGGDLPRKR